MRHDTTTTPASAPASTMASSLSARIDALERELHDLFAQRTGQIEPSQGWGWCTAGGRNSVFATDGEDTCRACTAELTADRVGGWP
jgi:hypothetical protein